MLKKTDNVAYSNDYIDFDNIVYDIATFFSDGMGLATKDINKIILDDDNFDEDDPTNIVLVRHIAWCNKSKLHKMHTKKDKLRINA